MRKHPLPSVDLIRQRLSYNSETGEITWKKSGKVAGTTMSGPRSKGYRAIGLDRGKLTAHRVAWVLHYGKWPEHNIDHINGDRGDNRIKNLRDVTHAENTKNQRLRTNNLSGRAGVYWVPRKKVWRAQIKVGGKTFYLGSFANKKDAIATRKAAEIQHGFHPNHGIAL